MALDTLHQTTPGISTGTPTGIPEQGLPDPTSEWGVEALRGFIGVAPTCSGGAPTCSGGGLLLRGSGLERHLSDLRAELEGLLLRLSNLLSRDSMLLGA